MKYEAFIIDFSCYLPIIVGREVRVLQADMTTAPIVEGDLTSAACAPIMCM